MQFYPRGFCRITIREAFKKLMDDLDVDQASKSYALRRLSYEGLSFLTKTLPLYSKFVLASLERGSLLPRSSMSNFSWKGALPVFLRSLLQRIFSLTNGRLLPSVCTVAIWQIRQICDYFYKLATDFSDSELRDAERRYLETEKSLRERQYDEKWVTDLRKNLRYYPSFTNTALHAILEEHRPRYGPGTFCATGHDVYTTYSVYKRLPGRTIGTCRRDQTPFLGYFKAYPSSSESLSTHGNEGKCSEVLFVPKDSRSPRTISREPLHLLRMQMSFFDFASSALERDTCHRINFRDQSINQNLAREGSKTRGWATLDLKDGSDNVSVDLIRKLFEFCPALSYFIRRVRSTHTYLPSGGVIPLRKVAGMGSGLTFPIMAFLIHISVCTLVQRRFRLNYRDVASKVYVYGDDLIVPTGWYTTAVEALKRSGLLVNSAKSFIHSHFRESCGGDFYDGQSVTPVRLKLTGARLPRVGICGDVLSLRSEESLLQLERHCRELVLSGLVALSNYYYSCLERRLGSLPLVSGVSPILGRYTLSTCEIGDDAFKAYVPIPVIEKSTEICEWKYLGGYLIPTRVPEEGHLQNFGEVAIPRRIKLKKRLVYGHTARGVEQS